MVIVYDVIVTSSVIPFSVIQCVENVKLGGALVRNWKEMGA